MGQETTKILVVDDDMRLRSLLERYLVEQGYQVRAAANAEQMDRMLERENFHLMVLDLMLPGEDGLSICRRLRQKENEIPIVMLTAKGDEVDRIIGLEMGADDYICKPFFARELQARIKTQLRHRAQLLTASVNNEYDFSCERNIQLGSLLIEFASHQAFLAKQAINLTATEFDLLAYFASHPNHVFSRQQLLDKVWGYQHSGYEHTVNSHINRLRSKLEQHHQAPFIETVWGVGYKLNPSQLSN